MPDPNDVSILASKKYSEEKTINQLAQKVLFVCVCACIYIYTMYMCLFYTLASNISCLFVTLKYKTRQGLYTHGHPHKIYQYVYMNTFSTTVPVARTI